MLKLSRVGRHQTKKHKHRRAAAAKPPSCSSHPSSVDSWHLFFWGGENYPPPSKNNLQFLPERLPNCVLLIFFFDRNNEAYKHVTETLF